MDHHNSSLRVGAAVILCALAFRLFSPEMVERAASWLTQPNIAAFLTYLETGRNVRFSASQAVFLDYAAESPPPEASEAAEILQETQPVPVLPVFAAEDASTIELYYANSLRPDIGALLQQSLNWDLTESSPAVLILHTHTTESYTKSGESYQESSAWRTLDEDYNMLSIGARVAQILEENGIATVQDRELHDYPSYNGSYTDARKSIQEYLEEYPSIQLVLDLHRDASDTGSGQLRTLAKVDGQSTAQLMLVMGTNHDDYETNLALALKLQVQLENLAPGITRPLVLRSSRFNQDLCDGALLVEVGAAGNTHQEALRAAEILANAIIALAHGSAEG